MTNIKKCDVGKINLDLFDSSSIEKAPYIQYTHELPLLSFGDVQNTVNLSLVFNYERYKDDKDNNKNPFFIAAGYKLNLQKRLTINQYDVPTMFQGEDGRNINILSFGSKFTFDDESQRILRRTEQNKKPILDGNTTPDADNVIYNYTVEHSDFSTEKYNELGRITAVYDKYGNDAILSYSYNDSGHLTSITFRGSKVVSLGYVSNRLDSITYNGLESKFFYNNDGTLDYVEHYTGVKYKFSLSVVDFANDLEVDVCESDYKVEATPISDSTTVLYSKELKMLDSKTFEITDKIGNEVVDKATYRTPVNWMYTQSHIKYVDVIDFNSVETRTQFSNSKAMYSYEVQGGNPIFDGEGISDRFSGNVILYNEISNKKSEQSSGIQTRKDGLSMFYDPASDNSEYRLWSKIIDEHNEKPGYYTISGWIKSNDINSNSKVIEIKCHNDNSYSDYTVFFEPDGPWQYFTITTYLNADTIYVRTTRLENINLRDIRVTFCGTGNETADLSSHINMSEHLLLHTTDPNIIIPFKYNNENYLNDTQFCYTLLAGDDIAINGDGKTVTFSDVMRYKLKKKHDGICNEVYYNDCKDMIAGTTDLKVDYNGSSVSISNFDLGIRTYSGGKESLTRISIDENDPNSNIVKTYSIDGTEISKEILNKNLDVIETISQGVKTSYEYASSNCGLIFKHTTAPVENASDANTIVKQYNYNASLTKLESSVDEFGNTTNYTTDDIYGVITGITLPDGMVITDTYDDDKCALMSRVFSNATNSRSTSFDYSKGLLSSLVHGDETNSIRFDFEYDKNKLTCIKKASTPIEEHLYPSNTQVNSYYPTDESSLHSQICTYDNYGRLTKIDGLVENVYDIDPTYDENGDLTSHNDNSSAVLATSKDLTNNQFYRYHYNDHAQLERIDTEDSSGAEIDAEEFQYDQANRLTQALYGWNGNPGKYIISGIDYEKETTHPLVDDKIENYTYTIGELVEPFTGVSYVTSNTFSDPYGRLTSKSHTLEGRTFTKSYEYLKTRIIKFTDDTGFTTYDYDNMGRIILINDGTLTTYEYDSFGQLIRENNAALDKTFVYEYNDIGNVLRVKTYNYTTYSLGTLISQQGFGYDTTHPDRLTSYGGMNVNYDAIGCPTSYNGYTASWTRGKLSKLTKGNRISGTETYNYSYNAFGQRTSRNYTYSLPTLNSSAVAVGTLTGYNQVFTYDHSGRLVQEIKSNQYYGEVGSSDKIVYLYDENSIIGIVYTSLGNTNTYYFQRNLQGDVIGIYNTSGTKVGGYAYDAWGNCTITLNTNSIVARNPIRYRGYYYDTDTELYYLNARYYSPTWHRFISPAQASLIHQSSIDGLNLYSYAHNSPVSIKYNSSFVNVKSDDGGFGSVSATNSLVSSSSLNSSGWLGSMISSLSSAHGVVDKVSSYLVGSVDGLLSYAGIAKFNGFQSQLTRYSNWLLGIGIGLDLAASAYDNYHNPNMTAGQKWASFAADVGYIGATSALAYGAGALVTKGSVALGTATVSYAIGATIGGVTIGFTGAIAIGSVVVVVGFVSGTILIAVVSDALDNWWEQKKEEWFS